MGCGDNNNRYFRSKEECHTTCLLHQDSLPADPAVAGVQLGRTARWGGLSQEWALILIGWGCALLGALGFRKTRCVQTTCRGRFQPWQWGLGPVEQAEGKMLPRAEGNSNLDGQSPGLLLKTGCLDDAQLPTVAPVKVTATNFDSSHVLAEVVCCEEETVCHCKEPTLDGTYI